MNTTPAYAKHYHELATPLGRQTLDAVRRFTASHSEFTSMECIDDACTQLGCVDAWHVLNSLDQLVTEGVILELTNRDLVMGQHRKYRSKP